MAAEHSSDCRLEVAHVLFADIVGFSKLLIGKQRLFATQLVRAKNFAIRRGRSI